MFYNLNIVQLRFCMENYEEKKKDQHRLQISQKEGRNHIIREKNFHN